MRSGRVKAGAKGIERFASDKLGDLCEMTTIFDFVTMCHQSFI